MTCSLSVDRNYFIPLDGAAMQGRVALRRMVDSGRTDAEMIGESRHLPESFAEVYFRHRDAVYAFVVRRAGSAEAADLTAIVFEKALKLKHRYDLSQPNALPWLYGIARNVVGDRTRQRRRQERFYSPRDTSAGFESDALERVMAESVRDRLEEALRKLNPRDLEPLLMYALDGLSYTEIGRALDVPPGTVATRIARARAALNEVIPELAQKTDRTHETQEPKPDV